MDTGVGVAETEDTVSKEPERVVLKFASSQEALEYMRESGDWDKYSRGIIPTMASEELDYAEKLLNNEYDRFIVVDKASMKVILYSRPSGIRIPASWKTLTAVMAVSSL